MSATEAGGENLGTDAQSVQDLGAGSAGVANGQLSVEAENERLRERITALEAELVEVQARTNTAIAKWQEQAYWLDRWHLDLNALMRRPGATELLGTVRAVRGAWWRVKLLKRRLLGS
jgi:malic enzyme